MPDIYERRTIVLDFYFIFFFVFNFFQLNSADFLKYSTFFEFSLFFPTGKFYIITNYYIYLYRGNLLTENGPVEEGDGGRKKQYLRPTIVHIEIKMDVFARFS